MAAMVEDLAQRLRASQVAEQHGHELAPPTEPAGVALVPVLDDGPFKLGAGNSMSGILEARAKR